MKNIWEIHFGQKSNKLEQIAICDGRHYDLEESNEPYLLEESWKYSWIIILSAETWQNAGEEATRIFNSLLNEGNLHKKKKK